MWPETQKLKRNIANGKFEDSQEVKDRFNHARLAIHPQYKAMLDGLRHRQQDREDAKYFEESKPESWWVKITRPAEF